jgi:AraC-like DNA-binding protein
MLLTGFCLGCIAALFLNILRDFRHIFIAQVFLALLVAASAFLLHDFLPQGFRWLAGDIMTTLPAIFWLLCIIGFSESPSLRTPFTGIAIISFLVPAFGRQFGAENPEAELLHLLAWKIPQICEYIVILHGMWAIYSGWKGDLVETRRRIRAYILVILGLTSLSVTISLNFGVAENLPLFVTTLCCIACIYMMLGTKRGVLLQYETKVRALDVADDSQVVTSAKPEAKPAEIAEQDEFAEKLNILMLEKYYRCERLTLRRLAQKLDVPEHKLRALINQRFGYRSFSEYINKLRIEEASFRLVQEPTTPIQNIALDAGYRTMSSFNRAFRDIRKCTPTEYRVSKNAQTEETSITPKELSHSSQASYTIKH